jgi:hypothetical protein
VITRFSIAASHTLNLGDYNSFRVECSLTVDVPEGDDFEVLKDRAQTELRRLLEETYKAQRRQNGDK